MAEVLDKRFYVLRVISGKEGKVKEQLEAEMRLTDLGLYLFQVIIPTEKIVSQRNGKKVTKERPSMPGYILIEAILGGDAEYRLRNTANVIGFLGSKSGDPEPLKAKEVERILRQADELLVSEGDYQISLVEGDVVKVMEGAFAGCEAEVVEVVNEKHKLKVMVKMFGRRIPLELAFAQVTKG